jgi:energy-coupling factor transporter ATP-binding protein EcfA2
VHPFHLEVSGLEVELGGRPVLRGLDLIAAGGQVLAVVGRNGAGKTTLLRALAGLQVHSGIVTVEGGRPHLGMVFQNPDLQLFCPTVRDEILYRLADPDLARYAWLVKALSLTRYQETPPLLLSEGEKKRLALATILMRGFRHGVLLDEPTLGQDGRHRAMLVRLIRALTEAGQLVVLATHDLDLAAQADRLLLLDAGGIVADGPPDEVLSDRAAWAAAGLVVPDWVRVDKLAVREAPGGELVNGDRSRCLCSAGWQGGDTWVRRGV